MTDLKGRNAAVLGFGVEGASAAKFLKQAGAHVTVCDQKTDLSIPDDYEARLGDNYLASLDDFDLVIPSPGVKHDQIKTTRPLVSPTQLFFERSPAPIIGVTGTKGKGTTASLIAKMLEEAGRSVHLAGNIGKPALDILENVKPIDYVVLELSSYQLYDVSIAPHIAVILMIEPDHMDWHSDMDDYVSAKANIAKHQGKDDIVVFKPDNTYSQQIAELSPGKRVPYQKAPGARVEGERIVVDNAEVCATGAVNLLGAHNLDNVCAALTAAWQITQDRAALKRAIAEFKGLEHRLEFVREVNGVKYYNDSVATNPSSSIAALKSFEQPVVLIAGGSDKKADFRELGSVIGNSSVKTVLTIGDTARSITEAVKRADDKGRINIKIFPDTPTMAEVVEFAHSQAESGDVVLLSPASASFGLFESYKERGRLFKEVVNSL